MSLTPEQTLGPEPAINAGWSTCPMCQRTWWVTPDADCMVPACGHYGTITDARSNTRPCSSCGLSHAMACIPRPEPVPAPRVTCPLCVQWRCEGCKSDDWPNCCDWTTDAEPYWPDGSVAVITQDAYCDRCAKALADYEAEKDNL